MGKFHVLILALKSVTSKTLRTSNGRYIDSSYNGFLDNLIQSEDLYLLYIFGVLCLIGLAWLLVKLWMVERISNVKFTSKNKSEKNISNEKFRNLSESTVIKFKICEINQIE